VLSLSKQAGPLLLQRPGFVYHPTATHQHGHPKLIALQTHAETPDTIQHKHEYD
jgi:hypothetical protein